MQIVICTEMEPIQRTGFGAWKLEEKAIVNGH